MPFREGVEPSQPVSPDGHRFEKITRNRLGPISLMVGKPVNFYALGRNEKGTCSAGKTHVDTLLKVKPDDIDYGETVLVFRHSGSWKLKNIKGERIN